MKGEEGGREVRSRNGKVLSESGRNERGRKDGLDRRSRSKGKGQSEKGYEKRLLVSWWWRCLGVLPVVR